VPGIVGVTSQKRYVIVVSVNVLYMDKMCNRRNNTRTPKTTVNASCFAYSVYLSHDKEVSEAS